MDSSFIHSRKEREGNALSLPVPGKLQRNKNTHAHSIFMRMNLQEKRKTQNWPKEFTSRTWQFASVSFLLLYLRGSSPLAAKAFPYECIHISVLLNDLVGRLASTMTGLSFNPGNHRVAWNVPASIHLSHLMVNGRH